MKKVKSIFDDHHGAVMVLVLILVSFYYFTLVANAPADICGPDGKAYEKLAYKTSQAESVFAKGNFNGSYWSPAWVVSIAVLNKNVGRKPAAIRIGLIYFALLGGYLIYLMAGKISGPLAGIVAALVFLLSDHVKLFITYYQYEIPSTVLLLAIVYIFLFKNPGNKISERGRSKLSVAVAVGLHLVLGIVAGWTLLMSPRVLVLIGLLAICLWFHNSRRQYVVKLTGFVLGILVVLVPWTTRNYQCYGDFIPFTTNGGVNLYIGNNALATNGYFMPAVGVRLPFMLIESAAWTEVAIDYMMHHPVTTLKRFATRFYMFWQPEFKYQGYVLFCFVVGMIRFWLARRRVVSQSLWLLGSPLLISLFHMVFFHQWRYIIIIWPYICILAAVAVFGVIKTNNEMSELEDHCG